MLYIQSSDKYPREVGLMAKKKKTNRSTKDNSGSLYIFVAIVR